MNMYRLLIRFVLPGLALWSWHPLSGQSTLDLRINEILVYIDTIPRVTSGEEFAKFDPRGAGMTVIAMGVVFIALALLYLIFKMTSMFLAKDLQGKLMFFRSSKAKEGTSGAVPEPRERQVVTGEINAVIAMTLYLYSSEMHDAENTVLTINKVSRTYSPWSSKIYSIRKTPN